jgi:hypothetical protein
MHSTPPFSTEVDAPSSSNFQQRPSATTRVPHRSAPRMHRDSTAVTAVGNEMRGADYVTILLAAAMTGCSPKAIRRKIEAGVWVEGREFRRAPDGHVLISVKGYELWVERGRV